MIAHIKKISRLGFTLRLLVIFFACVTPIICITFEGYLGSLSSYWETDLQPLFILANATTSYYLFGLPKWRVSACFLLLLTAFSVENYRVVHDVLAIIFFISNLYPLYKTHHFRSIFWIYLSSLLIMPFDMLLAEIVAIWTLCLYHGLVLRRVFDLQGHEKKEK
jgi:hypothetical protein